MDDVAAVYLNRPMPIHAVRLQAFQKCPEVPINERWVARSLKVDVDEVREPSPQHPIVFTDGLEPLL